jgi:hypothetical protein
MGESVVLSQQKGVGSGKHLKLMPISYQLRRMNSTALDAQYSQAC